MFLSCCYLYLTHKHRLDTQNQYHHELYIHCMTHHQLAKLIATKKPNKSFEYVRHTATKRRSTADRWSSPSSLLTCVLHCKNLNNRKKIRWNEEKSTGGSKCRQICLISFSGEMSLRSFNGSERSINYGHHKHFVSAKLQETVKDHFRWRGRHVLLLHNSSSELK